MEFQRHWFTSRDAKWRQSVESLRRQLSETSDQDELLRLRGRLSEWLRSNRETLEEGTKLLGDVIGALRDHGDSSLLVSNLIRYATALQYSERHDEAQTHFEEALELAVDLQVDRLIDFAHQHYGKCLVEMNELALANQHFSRALEIREQRGDSHLISSTERAIQALASLDKGLL